MEVIDSPQELFKELDASGLETDSYDFEILKDDESGRTVTVEYEDLSDPEDDVEAAHEALRESAISVETDKTDIDADATYHTVEDGENVVYHVNTSRMGYKVMREDDFGGYTVVFPDEAAKELAE